MVVNDLNPFWTSVAPLEADTPLIIDSDTVLPRTVTAQTLEPVARRNPRLLPLTRVRTDAPQFPSTHELPFPRRGVDE